MARTAAATCAVLEGFDVDQLGDLRLLVDEVFVALVQGGARRIELRLALGDGRLEMELIGRHGGPTTAVTPTSGSCTPSPECWRRTSTVELDRDPPRFAATMAAT